MNRATAGLRYGRVSYKRSQTDRGYTESLVRQHPDGDIELYLTGAGDPRWVMLPAGIDPKGARWDRAASDSPHG